MEKLIIVVLIAKLITFAGVADLNHEKKKVIQDQQVKIEKLEQQK